jgi:hypothetical protein
MEKKIRERMRKRHQDLWTDYREIFATTRILQVLQVFTLIENAICLSQTELGERIKEAKGRLR